MRPDHATAHGHFARLDHAGQLSEDGPTWCGVIDNCDVCSRPMDCEAYMIDGPARAEAGSPWANLCVVCAYKTCPTIAWGSGQLYRRFGAHWHLVAGGPPSEERFEM